MKVPNKKIGVLDLNIDNLFILNSLRQKFINDDIYYINDVSIENVDEMDKEELNQIVSKLISSLLEKEIDLLLVVSDSIIEFCEELFNDIKIPVIQIINETIEYVNEQYEHKNVGFLSSNSMIEANIYQKNIRYNHLYNMPGDELRDLIRKQLVKTSESFQEAKNIVAPVYKKELDIIVPSLINYLSVKTEINEFLKDVILIPVDEILVNLVINNLYPNQELPSKGKGMTYICSYVPNDVSAINRILKTKYKVIDLNIVLNK